MNPSTVRAAMVRRIVAEVFDRSMMGTREGVRLRGDLDIRGSQEDEISRRVLVELGVEVPAIEWKDFSTVGDIVQFVELEIGRRTAVSE